MSEQPRSGTDWHNLPPTPKAQAAIDKRMDPIEAKGLYGVIGGQQPQGEIRGPSQLRPVPSRKPLPANQYARFFGMPKRQATLAEQEEADRLLAQMQKQQHQGR